MRRLLYYEVCVFPQISEKKELRFVRTSNTYVHYYNSLSFTTSTNRTRRVASGAPKVMGKGKLTEERGIMNQNQSIWACTTKKRKIV